MVTKRVNYCEYGGGGTRGAGASNGIQKLENYRNYLYHKIIIKFRYLFIKQTKLFKHVKMIDFF